MTRAKHAIVAVLSAVLIALIPLALFQADTQAATRPKTCYVKVAVKEGNSIYVVVCNQTIGPLDVNDIANGNLGGGTITLPLGPTLTLKPIVKTKTIRVPGPTVRLQGPTRTVRVTGPTQRVTIRPNIPRPSTGRTVTSTAIVRVTGQAPTKYVTVVPQPVAKPEPRNNTHTRIETVIEKVLLGTLASLVLAALGFLALLIGYYWGDRDARNREKRFLGITLDYLKSGKHS